MFEKINMYHFAHTDFRKCTYAKMMELACGNNAHLLLMWLPWLHLTKQFLWFLEENILMVYEYIDSAYFISLFICSLLEK